jgi:hypothetical protein
VLPPSGTAPVITVAPVLAGPVSIGATIDVTAATVTGDPTPTVVYTLRRDGVAVAGLTDVSFATLAAHVYIAADIGPSLTVRVDASNSEGVADDVSNAIVFDDATFFPATAIAVSTAGISLVSGDVDEWAATLGGVSCTLTAPGAAHRPDYSATGGVGSRPRVDCGTSDRMNGSLTKGSDFTTYEWGIVARQTAPTATGARAITYTTATSVARFGIAESNVGDYRVFVAGGANVDPAIDPSVAMAHWSGDAASGTINARLNGTVEATASATVTTRPDGEEVALGALPSGVNPAAFQCQGWYCGPVLTSDQRLHLRALLTYHTGVAA